MGVAIDEAGDDGLAGRVDDFRVGRTGPQRRGGADRSNHAVRGADAGTAPGRVPAVHEELVGGGTNDLAGVTNDGLHTVSAGYELRAERHRHLISYCSPSD